MRGRTRRRARPRQPSIEVDQDGGTPVVRLTGEFDLSTRADLERQLQTVHVSDHPTIVLDLSATTFIDTTVINTLVGAYRLGTEFIIRGATAQPRQALEVLSMGELFVFEDQD